MDGVKVDVVDNNEHLGQIISGFQQESKNVDNRLTKGRKSLFGLLGAGFAYKCMLSPAVMIYLYKTFTCPIIRSGLSTFVLRSQQIEPISLFQRKTFKSILKLSKTAPTPAIHFILGEIPIEGLIHRDIFSLFYCVWSNPDTKIHKIVKYLLEHSNNNSRTWSTHLKHLSEKYNMEDPLFLILSDPPPKHIYMENVKIKILAFYEKYLRTNAIKNSRMKYFNVSTIGLTGKIHPSVAGVMTTNEVKNMRPHIKMLTGDFLTYKIKSEQSGGSPHCRFGCVSISGEPISEDISHIVSCCVKTSQIRNRILSDIEAICGEAQTIINFNTLIQNSEELTQFILDPSSLNLHNRISLSDPILPEIFRLSRQLCAALDQERKRQLNLLNN